MTLSVLPHLFFRLRPSGRVTFHKVYRSGTQTSTCAKSPTHTGTHVHTPEVADFPGSRVEERGGDEQTREAAPVEPGRRAMPLVHRQEVEHRPAHQTRKDPKLDERVC